MKLFHLYIKIAPQYSTCGPSPTFLITKYIWIKNFSLEASKWHHLLRLGTNFFFPGTLSPSLSSLLPHQKFLPRGIPWTVGLSNYGKILFRKNTL